MGQLDHIAPHYLSKSIIKRKNRKQYLVCVIADYSGIAWAEIVAEIPA